MELVLTRQEGALVLVTCDGQRSHTFDLISLVSHTKTLPSPLDDPIAYGRALFQALFPPETLARRMFDALPERILLVTDAALRSNVATLRYLISRSTSLLSLPTHLSRTCRRSISMVSGYASRRRSSHSPIRLRWNELAHQPSNSCATRWRTSSTVSFISWDMGDRMRKKEPSSVSRKTTVCSPR